MSFEQHYSIDLDVISPITSNEYHKFSISYTNFPKRNTMTNYLKKELDIPNKSYTLYQPLKHEQEIWSISGIKNTVYYN